jgi:hypothetical protein
MKNIVDLTKFRPDDNFEWEDYVILSNKVNSIDTNNINNELSLHSAAYSYYNGVLHKVKRELDLQNNILERLEADIRSSFIKSYMAVNKTKPTDKMAESTVLTNDDYQNQKKCIIDLEYKYNLFKGLCYAMEHRKDCLVQLSSNLRAENKLLITG